MAAIRQKSICTRVRPFSHFCDVYWSTSRMIEDVLLLLVLDCVSAASCLKGSNSILNQ